MALAEQVSSSHVHQKTCWDPQPHRLEFLNPGGSPRDQMLQDPEQTNSWGNLSTWPTLIPDQAPARRSLKPKDTKRDLLRFQLEVHQSPTRNLTSEQPGQNTRVCWPRLLQSRVHPFWFHLPNHLAAKLYVLFRKKQSKKKNSLEEDETLDGEEKHQTEQKQHYPQTFKKASKNPGITDLYSEFANFGSHTQQFS